MENQQLSTSINLAYFRKSKEKVVSTQHTMDVEMLQSVMRIEENQQLEVSGNSNSADNGISLSMSRVI